MKKAEKKKLGDLLVQADMITKDQLKEALQEQVKTGKKLGEILVEKGWVTEQNIIEVLEFQLGIPQVDLSKYVIDAKAAGMINENLAKRHLLIPIKIENNHLVVAMSDPLNVFALDDVQITTKMEVIPVIASHSDVKSAIDRMYGASKVASIAAEFQKQMQEKMKKQATYDNDSQSEEEVLNSPAVQLVNNIIEQAIRRNASDIHIEPFETYVRVRLRIDGQLQELLKTDLTTLNAMVTRIKILGKMNIAEKRIPQDGRIGVTLDNNQLDLRVNVLPTIYGEKVVIRLIYRTGMQLRKEQLGFYPEDLDKFTSLLKNPHGIILVTGPTGSGKSTTLAAALRELNRPNVNIITVEDPVENMIDGINQVHVNVKAGLTFANALRAILRQDPDIVMIGEMRDSETCSIAVRAAITGHLVLSTLHTNDAPSSVTRMIDMGIEPFMVATAVQGIIAQRLVRKICSNCSTPVSLTEEEAEILKVPIETVVYKGKGCQVCNNTGYKGRMAVHEVMTLNAGLRELIAKGANADEIKEAAIQNGMNTLWTNTRRNVLDGKTTVEELLRVAYGQD
ncbi:GspE/PulE family protein [Defluviitalea saccharophila]|uniref:ATPase, T2SS/T4P/T4SS family n=1 Tax=Defluviitalea saccharophila TaxID=879970 RepID=A0ABZ2Y5G1_9FIRM|nr:Flp pilus assembly complex ATPase component TadA [Candidatus Epulonipiscium sp.]